MIALLEIFWEFALLIAVGYSFGWQWTALILLIQVEVFQVVDRIKRSN